MFSAALVACESTPENNPARPQPVHGSDDLEKLLDGDRRDVERMSRVDVPGSGTAATDASAQDAGATIATAVDAGVTADAGVDPAAALAEKKRREKVEQHRRLEAERRKRDRERLEAVAWALVRRPVNACVRLGHPLREVHLELIARLKATAQVFESELDEMLADDDVWEFLDIIETSFASERDGVIYTADEGFFDEANKPLRAFQ